MKGELLAPALRYRYVLVSAVLSPDSTANLAYQKALDTGILLILVQTFAECENVIFCSKFDRYISVVTVVGLRNATQQIKRE